ncbi:O-antigen ligase family protein [Halalkalicoccus ordinarius]|uniref:O-antigen ligase family protein n=1 Tax=Halalkalicoccus ordinarius TaxID=3116651 RepID=UPI00300ED6F7
MSGSRSREYLWGRSSSNEDAVPLHYPLLAVLAIAASIAPTTWLLSDFHGYLVSGAVLCLVIGYGVLFADIRIRIDSAFLVLFGGYWVGLLVHYLYLPNPSLLQYIFVTPITVFATVVVLPRFVADRPQSFAMGLTLLAVLVMGIGVLMLWQFHTSGIEYSWVGEEVMGLYAIRTPSVFANPNTYGFFMMIGSLAALYTVLVRGGLIWIAALGLCLLGLFMSEGDAAIFGFGLGSVLVLSGRNRILSFVGVGASVAAIYAMIRVGHFSEVMQTTLMSRVDRWVLSLERLALDPLWGIGFVDAGPEIGGYTGPHNSYIEVLLHTGVIAGMLYLGALIYAAGCGIRNRWTQWTGFVVGTAAGVFTYMFFESLILGGLSTSSVVLGLVTGLMLLPDPKREHGRVRSTASEHSSRPPVVERTLSRVFSVRDDGIESSSETEETN